MSSSDDTVRRWGVIGNDRVDMYDDDKNRQMRADFHLITLTELITCRGGFCISCRVARFVPLKWTWLGKFNRKAEVIGFLEFVLEIMFSSRFLVFGSSCKRSWIIDNIDYFLLLNAY